MNKKGLDFKHKEVINIKDAKRLGFVQDVTADFKTGTITSIIVPGNTKLFSIFSTRERTSHSVGCYKSNWRRYNFSRILIICIIF
jgi:YlmC/YmxH family sporulation protein